MKYIVILSVMVAAVFALVFGSSRCGAVFPQEAGYEEAKDDDFLRAQEYVREGRTTEALDAFRRIIRQYPDASAESNFEVGYLAFCQGDFPLAIYHFNQSLALQPNASEQKRDRIVGLINSSRKKFLQEMLPGREAPAGASVPDLEEKYLAVMQENEALKREVARLRAGLSEERAQTAAAAQTAPAVAVPAQSVPAATAVASGGASVPATTLAPEPPKPAVPATHVVAKGDTLSGISRKYYGTSARWQEIYRANRATMDSPSDLKPGMVLKLPRP